MKKKLVIANWKTYVESPQAAKKFAASLRRKMAGAPSLEAWIAAPAPLIPALAGKGSVKIGAQSVSAYVGGAHTGELSAVLLKASGAAFALVGHSERRAAGEGEEAVQQQLVRAVEVGLTPVLCVGESERSPEGTHFGYIEGQLTSALRGSQSLVDKMVVAYEPVWAIGKTAKDAMQAAELEETAIFIRKVLSDVLGRERARKIPVLYGGSVEPENTAQLIAEGGVNGFLVGHASAEIESFQEILNACRKSA